mmetsp:Transcript_66112/g.183051  ORF Transcript_66112/g.183051 Transcript_66112/m.183051 type:complete len:399 (+) Transcript_66112:91-1287(+)
MAVAAGAAPALVLDNGSGSCKAGFAGDGAPRVDFPAVVGWPRAAGAQPGAGRAAARHGGVLLEPGQPPRGEAAAQLGPRHPLEHGVVVDWEGMERVWRHALSQLEAPRGKHPLLVTEAPLNPKANREQMVQLMFEEFDMPAVHVAVSGALSLYATGSRTGVVLEAGDGTSHVVPIFDDYVVPHAVRRLDLGGRDLTAHLARLLREERGYRLEAAAERRAAAEVKERLCYVAQHFRAELRAATEDLAQEQSYALPDGSAVIAAGSELFRCPEALFQPALVGREAPGVHEMALQAITGCDVDVQRSLSSNIVLSGGTMMFRGMRERVLKELAALLPPTAPTRVSLPPEPRHAAFIGGSILASLGDFQRNWISRQDYEEFGTSIIHTKSMCLTEAGIRKGM